MVFALTWADQSILDQEHDTMWGGSSDHGEDYWIGW
jgi:hypothetical protein